MGRSVAYSGRMYVDNEIERKTDEKDRKNSVAGGVDDMCHTG